MYVDGSSVCTNPLMQMLQMICELVVEVVQYSRNYTDSSNASKQLAPPDIILYAISFAMHFNI